MLFDYLQPATRYVEHQWPCWVLLEGITSRQESDVLHLRLITVLGPAEDRDTDRIVWGFSDNRTRSWTPDSEDGWKGSLDPDASHWHNRAWTKQHHSVDQARTWIPEKRKSGCPDVRWSSEADDGSVTTHLENDRDPWRLYPSEPARGNQTRSWWFKKVEMVCWLLAQHSRQPNTWISFWSSHSRILQSCPNHGTSKYIHGLALDSSGRYSVRVEIIRAWLLIEALMSVNTTKLHSTGTSGPKYPELLHTPRLLSKSCRLPPRCGEPLFSQSIRSSRSVSIATASF